MSFCQNLNGRSKLANKIKAIWCGLHLSNYIILQGFNLVIFGFAHVFFPALNAIHAACILVLTIFLRMNVLLIGVKALLKPSP